MNETLALAGCLVLMAVHWLSLAVALRVSSGGESGLVDLTKTALIILVGAFLAAAGSGVFAYFYVTAGL